MRRYIEKKIKKEFRKKKLYNRSREIRRDIIMKYGLNITDEELNSMFDIGDLFINKDSEFNWKTIFETIYINADLLKKITLRDGDVETTYTIDVEKLKKLLASICSSKEISIINEK